MTWFMNKLVQLTSWVKGLFMPKKRGPGFVWNPWNTAPVVPVQVLPPPPPPPTPYVPPPVPPPPPPPPPPSGTLSAPTMDFPIPIAANPSSVGIHLGVDWIAGNILVFQYSSSFLMTSPTTILHTITNAEALAHSLTLPLPTLVGITYFQCWGRDPLDSAYKSNIVAWGDTTAPVITNSEIPGVGTALQIYEGTTFFQPISTTDAGGVPATISDGTTSGAFLYSGNDKLQFEVAVVAGVVGYRWFGNAGAPPASAPNDFGADNYYDLTPGVIDYSGNFTQKALQVHVNPVVVVIPNFTDKVNAALSTAYDSNTVTVSITPTGLPLSTTFSTADGFTISKNGVLQSSPFFTQDGDTLTQHGTSANANEITRSGTVTIGSVSKTWHISTPILVKDFTGAVGAQRNTWTNVTDYQVIVFNAIGFSVLVRSTASEQNVDWYIEGTINGFGAGGNFILGVDENARNLDTNGTGIPGQGSWNGFAIYQNAGNTVVTVSANNTTTNFTLPGGNVTGAGDTVGIRFNSSTNVATFFYYKNGVGDLGQIGTVTLTSLIPANIWIVQGGVSGNGTIATSDTITTNYGGVTSYIRTPPAGSHHFNA